MTPSRLAQFLRTYEREHATTMKVLRAYPDAKLDLKPAEMSKSARDLAKIFVAEQRMTMTALTTGFDWANPSPTTPVADTSIAEIAEAFDAAHGEIVRLLRDASEEQLPATVRFFVAPKTLGDIPTFDFLWFMLHDQIHHRGQFSVYLRMAGAKVPSIYGPSHDEPWN